MNKRNALAVYLAVLVAFGVYPLVWTHTQVSAAPANRILKVKLNYTGSGSVDDKHRIYVLLFDANPYTASSLIDATSETAPPAPAAGVSHVLARESAGAKDSTITFRTLGAPTVYAVAFFDKSGSYSGRVDPTSGSPMGVYGTFPDKLEPIQLEEGRITQLTLTFDDSKLTP